jgi:hypothetical protein
MQLAIHADVHAGLSAHAVDGWSGWRLCVLPCSTLPASSALDGQQQLVASLLLLLLLLLGVDDIVAVAVGNTMLIILE